MKAKAERLAWLMAHLGASEAVRVAGDPVGEYDVLNREFVDAYISAVNAPCRVMPYGADKCPQLGRDLAELHRAGKLHRASIGLNGMAGMGFPRWVWSYRLAASATASARSSEASA